MKLLNLNLSIKISNTERVLRLLEKQNPDIATFQEALNATEKGCFKKYRSKNDLEKKFKFSAFAPLFITDSITSGGKVIRRFGGKVEQGSLLLTNHKIARAENQFYYEEYKHGFDATHFHETEWCRSLQNAIIEVGGKQLQILNVHGIWNKGKVGNILTHQQTDFILKQVRHDIPCILVGDFNLLPDSEDIKRISAELKNLAVESGIKSTRAQGKEPCVCDYIFVNDLVSVKKFEALNLSISDHVPLLLEFDV